MGKASSAKKVARAARVGGSGQKRKRNWAFPAAIVAIIVIGAVVIYVARGSDQTAAATAPTVDDHWHAAYGIYVCDAFVAPIPQEPAGADKLGIHTHGDGIMHIHPFTAGSSGNNARFSVFGQTTGVDFGAHSITMPDGTVYKDGYDCNGTPAKLSVAQWNSADEVKADPNAPPDVVYTENFGDIKYTNDRMAFTIAILPDGTTIPPPQSIPTLDNLTDVASTPSVSLPVDTGSTVAPAAQSGDSTSSTVASSTTASTVAGATDSSTVP
jgi:hypothetical protein